MSASDDDMPSIDNDFLDGAMSEAGDGDAEESGDAGSQGQGPSRSGAGASKASSGSRTAKAKAKSKTKAPDRKKRGKIVDGKKWCKACQKWLAVENFPFGSAQCSDDRRIIQNLRKAAIAQNEVEWMDGLMSGPEEKLAKVVKAYKVRVDNAGGKARKAGVFPILVYEEEVKQETAIIVEGVYEMMHKAASYYDSI